MAIFIWTERQFYSILFFLRERDSGKKNYGMWFLFLQKELCLRVADSGCALVSQVAFQVAADWAVPLARRSGSKSASEAVAAALVAAVALAAVAGVAVAVAAKGDTLMVRAAGCSLVGAGGVLRLRPGGLRYVLTAQAKTQ
jgi:hypothetical protein